MEPVDANLDPERLAALARNHYRAARWDEALAAIAQLQAAGHSSRELDDLINDIKLKQRIEGVQVTNVAVAPPSPLRRIALPLAGVAGGLALLAAMFFGLAPQLSGPAVQPDSTALTRTIAEAVPTAAPPPTTAPAEQLAAAPTAQPAARGALLVDAAESAELTFGVRKVYLILDASGSMLARVGGERKIDLAQRALTGLINELPDDAQVALRVYGRRRPDDCSDIELLSQPGPLYREGLIAQIEAVEPVNLSRTPIAASLEATAADLATASGETLVVLVSDGDESCGGNPVAAAAALHQALPDVRVSVVGLDIAPEQRQQLAAIAVAGGGLYVDAGNTTELKLALNQVVTPSFRVLDSVGTEVGGGMLGERLELPAGPYTVVVGADQVLLEQAVEVQGGMATVVTISDEAGRLTAKARSDRQP